MTKEKFEKNGKNQRCSCGPKCDCGDRCNCKTGQCCGPTCGCES